LEAGKNVKLDLELKMKNKELPLYIRHEPFGVMTKDFEGTMQDDIVREKVEERLKVKDKVVDKNGYSYE